MYPCNDGQSPTSPFIIYKFTYLWIYPFIIHASVHPAIHLSIHPSSRYPFAHPSIHPSTHSSIIQVSIHPITHSHVIYEFILYPFNYPSSQLWIYPSSITHHVHLWWTVICCSDPFAIKDLLPWLLGVLVSTSFRDQFFQGCSQLQTVSLPKVMALPRQPTPND